MSAMNSYTAHFDENGGYDCMYGCFIIKNAAGAVLFEIDLRHYGQQPCEWDDLVSREAAGKVAQLVLDSLNMRLLGPNEREFLLRVCDEFFGCFIDGGYGGSAYYCGVCEIEIDVRDWITAPHRHECIVPLVRDYLAKHMPGRVQGYVPPPATGGGKS
jgi:hypothetical protein